MNAVYIKILNKKKRKKRVIRANVYKDIKLAIKALVVNKLIAIFYLGDRKS